VAAGTSPISLPPIFQRAVGRHHGRAQFVAAVPARRGNPKPPKRPKTPRVVELLRKALEWQDLLDSGEVPNRAAIAKREGLTRSRVTQVMGLLRLAPEIQEQVLGLPDMVRRPAVTEQALQPIAQIEDANRQLAAFAELNGDLIPNR